MPLLKLLADAGRRFFSPFRAAEFGCADCDYSNACAGTTDTCDLRAGQAKKWKQNRLPPMLVNVDAFIQRIHSRW